MAKNSPMVRVPRTSPNFSIPRWVKPEPSPKPLILKLPDLDTGDVGSGSSTRLSTTTKMLKQTTGKQVMKLYVTLQWTQNCALGLQTFAVRSSGKLIFPGASWAHVSNRRSSQAGINWFLNRKPELATAFLFFQTNGLVVVAIIQILLETHQCAE